MWPPCLGEILGGSLYWFNPQGSKETNTAMWCQWPVCNNILFETDAENVKKRCIDIALAITLWKWSMISNVKSVVDSWQAINTQMSFSITQSFWDKTLYFVVFYQLLAGRKHAQASHALFHSNLEGQMVNLMMTHPLSLELTCILGMKNMKSKPWYAEHWPKTRDLLKWMSTQTPKPLHLLQGWSLQAPEASAKAPPGWK